MTRDQAEQALSAGVDVLIAQGSEAGGFGGFVSTMVLVPQVVDLAGDVPVVAAGGIADGRWMAAALALGAAGVAMGTWFLASTEMAISEQWKQRSVAADALDAVKVPNSERVIGTDNHADRDRSVVDPVLRGERGCPKRIADPAGLVASERDGLTPNGESQVGVKIVGLDPNQRFTPRRSNIDGCDHRTHPGVSAVQSLWT